MDMQREGTVLRVILDREIDHHTAGEARAGIDAEAARLPLSRLILDFREVSFMDSSGVGLVLGRYRRFGSAGCRVELANLSPRAERIMALSGVTELLAAEAPRREKEGSA